MTAQEMRAKMDAETLPTETMEFPNGIKVTVQPITSFTDIQDYAEETAAYKKTLKDGRIKVRDRVIRLNDTAINFCILVAHAVVEPAGFKFEDAVWLHWRYGDKFTALAELVNRMTAEALQGEGEAAEAELTANPT